MKILFLSFVIKPYNKEAEGKRKDEKIGGFRVEILFCLLYNVYKYKYD